MLPEVLLAGVGAALLAGPRLERLNAATWRGVTFLAFGLAGAALAGAPPTDAVEAAARSVVRDSFGRFGEWLALIVGAASMLVLAFDRGRSPQQLRALCGLTLIGVASAMTIAIANDMILFFVALELLSLTLVLAGAQTTRPHHPTRADAHSAGAEMREVVLKQLILGALGAAFLTLGFAFVYGLTGSTNLAVCRDVLAATYRPPDGALPVGSGSRLGIAAAVLIPIGCSVRMGVVPMHTLRNETVAGTGIPLGAMTTSLWTIAGAFIVIRLLNATLVGFEQTSQTVLMVLSGATMLVGGLLALREERLPWLMAWLAVGQAGLIVAAIAAANWRTDGAMGWLGPAAALFWSLCHLAWLLLVLASLAVSLSSERVPLLYVSQLQGLAYRHRLAGAVFAVWLVAVAGLPPLSGFWARVPLLMALLRGHVNPATGNLIGLHAGFISLAIIVVLHAALTFAVCLRLATEVFLKDPLRALPANRQTPARWLAAVGAVVAVVSGFVPGIVSRVFAGW
jgi:NADH-quinone oxidoreductase subunit N